MAISVLISSMEKNRVGIKKSEGIKIVEEYVCNIVFKLPLCMAVIIKYKVTLEDVPFILLTCRMHIRLKMITYHSERM